GPYRICWGYTGPRKNNDNDMAPFVEDRVNYGVEVGTLLVFGPMFRQFDCVAGTECKVLVEGTGLSADKNRIFLVSGGTCLSVVNFLYEFYVFKSKAVIPLLEDVETGDVVQYFRQSTDINQEPYTEEFLSSVDVKQANLADLNITRVANYRPNSILVGPISVTPGLQMASTLNEYSMSALAVRGSDNFQACYLADPSSSLNAINFGVLRIIGPRPAARTYTCVLGSPCILGVTGLQLKRGVNHLA
ncbi:unnamed protein product, partial [Amoebophrya sp. A120]